MLVDSGSSASFFSPGALPDQLANEVFNFIKYNKEASIIKLKKMRINMSSFLSAKFIECAREKLSVKICEWCGKHEFIFTELRENAILGIDFWRKKNAIFDFTFNKEIIMIRYV